MLLKEVSKSKDPRLVNYVAKKLLPRLVILANSPLKENCLREFNKNAEANGSARFYHLLLECFQNWGGILKDINSAFFRASRELQKKGKIPVTAKYWGIPQEQTSTVDKREQSPNFSGLYNRSADNIDNHSGVNTRSNRNITNSERMESKSPTIRVDPPKDERLIEISKIIS